MNLYEIDQSIQGLVDQETGELLDFEAFAALQMERERKIENAALWVKNLLSDAAQIKEEEAALKARRQAMERRAARLKEYLTMALGGEKFETPRCAISWRKSKALSVLDDTETAEWLIENGYVDLVVQQMPTLDKNGIKALIKDGIDVMGCELIQNESIQIK